MKETGFLYLVCGKPAAGKSTLALHLAKENNAVLLSEDTWLSALFSDEMSTLADYVRCSQKLRRIIAPHVTDLLSSGVAVVLDFPANTIKSRHWLLDVIKDSKAGHALHLLDPPDAACIARLHQRNKDGEHPFALTEQEFDRIARHFQPPAPEEGFNVIPHRQVF